jgi:hypothetical protein
VLYVRIDGVVVACHAVTPLNSMEAARDAARWQSDVSGQPKVVLVDGAGEVSVGKLLAVALFHVDHSSPVVRWDPRTDSRLLWLSSAKGMRRAAVKSGYASRAAWV